MPSVDMRDRAAPEAPRVATRIVLVCVFGFVAFAAVAMAGLYLYIRDVAPFALASTPHRDFPKPALQSSPQSDLTEMRRERRITLNSYAWIDKSRAISRIPIDRAMQHVAERGARAYDPMDVPASAQAGAEAARP